MIYSFSTPLALALVAAAAIVAAFTLRGDSALQGWAIAAFGTLGLALAALGHTTNLLDVGTVGGVALFGGIAGAGWNPRGKKMLLALGLLSLVAGLLPRLFAALALSGASGEIYVGSLTWAVARSAGFVAFLAATGAVLLGVRRPARLPVGGLPARVYALHRALGIAAVLALVVHLAALWLDSFVQLSWLQLLAFPWTSSYRPAALTVGFLAMISLLLTAASGALRRVVPGWRVVHVASYVTFGLSVSHGLLAGSDSGSPFTLLLYLAALVAVAFTLLRRFSPKPGARRKPPKDRGDSFKSSTLKLGSRRPLAFRGQPALPPQTGVIALRIMPGQRERENNAKGG